VRTNSNPDLKLDSIVKMREEELLLLCWCVGSVDGENVMFGIGNWKWEKRRKLTCLYVFTISILFNSILF